MKENFLPFVLFFLVIKRCLCFCIYSFLVYDMDTSMLGVILKKKKCARKKQKKKKLFGACTTPYENSKVSRTQSKRMVRKTE